MFGWIGKILRIDLTTGNRFVEDLSPDLCRSFIGGRGAGLKMLVDEVDPRIDPLSPQNKLIFATGPLTGTGVPAGGRFVVVSKSPLSNCIANPCCGGYFGPNLKYAGYDFLILEGRAPSPVYLYIRDDRVELRDAEHLWGKWSTDTEEALRNEMGEADALDEWQLRDLSVVCIGPAGENRVRFACIMADGGRAAGRSGLGAVMGSKNLKAIAVSGTGQVDVADVPGYQQAVMDFLEEGRVNRVLYNRRMYGTWALPGRANKSGTQATRNFQEGYSKGFEWYEDPNHVRDHIRIRDEACFGCPFACSKRSRIKDPDYPRSTKGPEHESMALLGSNCGFSDLDDICRANYLCNELGLDTITAGATISCAMELFESGYLSEEDLGYAMGFGNTKAMMELLKKTAIRKDFGDVLAEGGRFVAEKYGHPELFMGVKGMGMPAWHPQGVPIIGLQYATNNVGGSHTKATLPFYDGRRDPEEHIKWTKHDQDYVALVDSAILCWIIYHGPLWGEKLRVWLNVITGLDYSDEELRLIGEKIWNMERLFNLQAGLTAKDDALPTRMTHEPRVKDQVVPMDRMLPEYYALRGWDEKGIPKAQKLAELGISQGRLP